MARVTQRLLKPIEAAELLGVPLATLKDWRFSRKGRGNRGPAYIKVERAVRYRLSDLNAYIKARRVSSKSSKEALK